MQARGRNIWSGTEPKFKVLDLRNITSNTLSTSPASV